MIFITKFGKLCLGEKCGVWVRIRAREFTSQLCPVLFQIVGNCSGYVLIQEHDLAWHFEKIGRADRRLEKEMGRADRKRLEGKKEDEELGRDKTCQLI